MDSAGATGYCGAMKGLSAAAHQRDLAQLSSAVREYDDKGWIGSPVDAATVVGSDLPELLTRLARRGLEPSLVEMLFQQLEQRPLERGLLAWDVLTSSLLAPDEVSFRDRLRAWARDVAAVLPLPGQRGFPAATMSSGELVREMSAPRWRSVDDEDLLAGIMTHDLGAFAQFRARHPDDLGFLVDEKLLAATSQLAVLLAAAHLPTLASFYQHFLWTELDHRDIWPDLVETLLDVGAADFVPLRDDLSASFAEYVRCRVIAASGHELKARALLSESGPAAAATPDRGSAAKTLLSSELAVTFGGAADALGEVHGIVERYPLWRYARRVQTQLSARAFVANTEPPDALFDQFVAIYGNDANVWYAMLMEAANKKQPWLRGTMRRLGGEVLALPHDAEAWRALARFCDEPDSPTLAELEAKLAEQSTF